MQYELSCAERQIMDFLWRTNEFVRTQQIMDYAIKEIGKTWKRQTLNTILIRLSEKDMIIRDRGHVTPKYTQQEWETIKVNTFIDENFNGKIENFLSAYFGNDKKDKIDSFLKEVSYGMEPKEI